MANCQKCGANLPQDGAYVRRINTGSGGIKVESNAFVCKSCAEGVDTWKGIVTAFWVLLFLFLLFNARSENSASNASPKPAVTQNQ